MTKRLPQSIDAEQAILGAILLYPETFSLAFEYGLKVEDFFQDVHQKIYLAAFEISEQGRNVDVALLINRLTEKNQIAQIGGAEYLTELINTATTISNLKSYIEIVRSKAQLRQLINTAHQILADSSDEKDDINDVFDRAEKMILDITHNRLTKDFKPAKEVTSTVLDLVKKMSENKTGITGMKTGYTALDNTTDRKSVV